MERDYRIAFPTLWIVPAWIKRHCIVPDGFMKSRPFRMYDWQLYVTAHHYRVREDAKQTRGYPNDPDAVPIRSKAFFYRRSQVMAPQKVGKGPWSATLTCAEAVGPVLFLGWAEEGDVYDCSDYGCGCGWVYHYMPGEPMGHPWPTPLIQLLATSEDQVDNVYRPLQAMAKGPRLSELMKVREGFIRLPNDGKIEVVTSSAQSRLGNPLTFCVQDETQLYTHTNKMVKTAQTMRRGAAAMGGRSIETTNCYDPAENSVAQMTHESTRPDIFRFYEPPPSEWSYKNKRERAKIHRYNYAGSPHVDLHGVESEAAELAETDPGQAERFYGNRIVQGQGSWLPDGLWKSAEDTNRVIPAGTQICLGFDGSDSDDWTTLRARTLDGFHFTPTYGPDDRPTYWNPAEWGGIVPRGEVHAAIDEICTRYKVIRAYCDPFGWQTDIADWALSYGDNVFLEWRTNRDQPMHEALVQYVTDLTSKRLTHDTCIATETAVANARKVARTHQRYIIGKPVGAYHQKIDLAMADVLAHKAGEDARLKGWNDTPQENYVWFPE